MVEVYKDALVVYKKIRNALGTNLEWTHYDQTFRAAGSVAANIAEGEGSKRGKEGVTASRWNTARGSLLETSAWIDIALIDGVILIEDVEDIKAEIEKLSDNLTKLMEGIDVKNTPPTEVLRNRIKNNKK